MTAPAIQYYHELMSKSDVSTLAETSACFGNALRDHKACYGERELSTFLRPKFITPQQFELINNACRILQAAVTKVKEAVFAQPDLLALLGLSEGERMLCEIDPGFSRLLIVSRWDSFMTESSEEGTVLKFVGLNADTPTGIACSDVMSDIYLRLPFMEEFRQHFNVQPFAIRAILLRQLLETYKDWKGRKSGRRVPQIGIIDWRGSATRREFELMQEYFESQGVPTVLADPRELEYHRDKSGAGRLHAGNFAIDLIYKRVPTNEFIEKLGEAQAMYNAIKKHEVCLINPFRARLVHKKALFAILTHENNEHLFNEEEKQIIRAHVPWTRRIEPCETVYRGQRIDLCDYIAQHKDDFVIKPNDGFAAKSVALGWETPVDQWERRIKDALDDFYVVQERVPIAKESFPYFDNGLRFAELVVKLDPCVFGTIVGGMLARLSSFAVPFATADCGVTSTFLIWPK
ncbi:MAG: hypothetical protein ONB44_19000 [candidate division KSB1 bacterium]|nr:hypothetical protein [candidate division KSB1 bacterium]MDZ7304220.1 hypothetical protein [candidate division KSB1 bacterium]MDZ7311695.1 hypothetical protein [candidate division KSB1 bacterium]